MHLGMRSVLHIHSDSLCSNYQDSIGSRCRNCTSFDYVVPLNAHSDCTHHYVVAVS